jgi:quercetin dioxygenase-like cupin family protein
MGTRRRTMAKQEKVLGNVGTDFRWENETFKTWELILEPGQTSPWHRHTMNYLFVVTEPGTLRAEYDDGTSEVITYELGQIVPGIKGSVHRVTNVGTKRWRNAVIEAKG